MTNKAKAFEILDEHLDVELEPVGKGMYYNSRSSVDGTEYIFLTNEEYDCLNACLNEEPDSIEKIIEEFKELGYEYFDCSETISFKNEYSTIITIGKGNYNCSKNYKHYNCPFKIEEIRLINRIYRLWEVEV